MNGLSNILELFELLDPKWHVSRKTIPDTIPGENGSLKKKIVS